VPDRPIIPNAAEYVLLKYLIILFINTIGDEDAGKIGKGNTKINVNAGAQLALTSH